MMNSSWNIPVWEMKVSWLWKISSGCDDKLLWDYFNSRVNRYGFLVIFGFGVWWGNLNFVEDSSIPI